MSPPTQAEDESSSYIVAEDANLAPLLIG